MDDDNLRLLSGDKLFKSSVIIQQFSQQMFLDVAFVFYRKHPMLFDIFKNTKSTLGQYFLFVIYDRLDRSGKLNEIDNIHIQMKARVKGERFNILPTKIDKFNYLVFDKIKLIESYELKCSYCPFVAKSNVTFEHIYLHHSEHMGYFYGKTKDILNKNPPACFINSALRKLGVSNIKTPPHTLNSHFVQKNRKFTMEPSFVHCHDEYINHIKFDKNDQKLGEAYMDFIRKIYEDFGIVTTRGPRSPPGFEPSKKIDGNSGYIENVRNLKEAGCRGILKEVGNIFMRRFPGCQIDLNLPESNTEFDFTDLVDFKNYRCGLVDYETSLFDMDEPDDDLVISENPSIIESSSGEMLIHDTINALNNSGEIKKVSVLKRIVKKEAKKIIKSEPIDDDVGDNSFKVVENETGGYKLTPPSTLSNFFSTYEPPSPAPISQHQDINDLLRSPRSVPPMDWCSSFTQYPTPPGTRQYLNYEMEDHEIFHDNVPTITTSEESFQSLGTPKHFQLMETPENFPSNDIELAIATMQGDEYHNSLEQQEQDDAEIAHQDEIVKNFPRKRYHPSSYKPYNSRESSNDGINTTNDLIKELDALCTTYPTVSVAFSATDEIQEEIISKDDETEILLSSIIDVNYKSLTPLDISQNLTENVFIEQQEDDIFNLFQQLSQEYNQFAFNFKQVHKMHSKFVVSNDEDVASSTKKYYENFLQLLKECNNNVKSLTLPTCQ